MKRLMILLAVSVLVAGTAGAVWAGGKSPDASSLVCPTCKTDMTIAAGPHGKSQVRSHFCKTCGSEFQAQGGEVNHVCANCKTQIKACPLCEAELKHTS